jgi:oligosaccharide repeat unit polymerase
MLAFSLICFSVTALLGLEILVRKSDFFSPGRLFVLAHSISLGVAFLAFHRAMTPFQPLTSIIYFGGNAAFLLGLLAVKLSVAQGAAAPRRAIEWKRYRWDIHLVVAFALLLFTVVGLGGALLEAGGFPLLAENKIKVLSRFMKAPGYFLFAFSYSGIVMALFFMYLVRPRTGPVWRNPVFWAVVLAFLVFSLALSRVALLFFVFFALVFYHQGVRRLSLPKLIGVFSLCFLLVLVTGYFKAKEIERETSIDIEKIAAVAFMTPYLYLANNFWNLDYALNPLMHGERHPTTYGFTSIEGFLDAPFVGFGGHLRRDTQIDNQFNERATKVRGLNTVTYHWTLYKDFGIAGVLFGSFLIGMFLGVLYHRVQQVPSLLNLAAYSYLAFFTANSVFGMFTESPTYAYGFFLVCATCYVCQVMAKGPATTPETGLADGL